MAKVFAFNVVLPTCVLLTVCLKSGTNCNTTDIGTGSTSNTHTTTRTVSPKHSTEFEIATLFPLNEVTEWEHVTVTLPPSSSLRTETFTLPPPPFETFPTATIIGPGILENSNIVLSSPLTKEFLSEFQNPLKIKVLEQQLQFCPFKPLCSFEWPETLSAPGKKFCCEGCSCSSDCEETMTCCPDIIPDSKYNRSHQAVHKECIANYLGAGALGVMAYARCPVDTDEELNMNCTRSYLEDSLHLTDITPLSDKDDAEMSYRNIYCAKCNGVNISTVSYWLPRFSCNPKAKLPKISGSNLIQSIIEAEGCDLYFLPPIMGMDNDCTVPISRCNQTGLWLEYDPDIEWACSFYTSPLESENGTYFRNVFCMLCNGHTSVYSLCSHGDSSQGGGDEFSFAALLNVENFERVSEASSDSSAIGQCPPDMVWLETGCIHARCSATRQLADNECVKIFDRMSDALYLLHARLIPADSMSTEAAVDSVFCVMQNLEMMSNSWGLEPVATQSIIHTDVLYFANMSTKYLLNSSLEFFDIRLQLKSRFWHRPEELLENILELNGKNNIVHCYISGIVRENEFTFYLKDDYGELYDRLYQNSSGTLNPDIKESDSEKLEDIPQISILNNEGEPLLIPFTMRGNYAKLTNMSISETTINMLSMRSCPFVNIYRMAFPWNETILGLKFRSDMFLNYSEFMYVPEHPDLITICFEIFTRLSQTIEITHDYKVSSSLYVETILSLCCVSLSIVCLLVTLISFCSLPAFATLPWKNNSVLALSLLMYHVLYVVGSFGRLTKGSVPCVIVGIGLHFFLLMAIIWMNICTFHMYRVIRSSKLVSKAVDWRKFLFYMSYSVIVSIFFVSVNIIYSLTENSSIGYGENICYLNSQTMVLVTFGVPLALVIVSNLVMFVMVVITIKRASNIQKSVKNERSLITIVAKLSIITGLTWVFGLAYMLTSIDAFSYVFIVLNGSQGVFLMVSFLCNNRVLTLYRKQMSRFSSTKYTT